MNSLASIYAEALDWMWWQTHPHIPLSMVLSERDATAKILLTKDDNGS